MRVTHCNRQLAALHACIGCLLLASSGCSHGLQVRNLNAYQTPFTASKVEKPLRVAIRPFDGKPDELFYFNAVVERLNASHLVSDLQTEYGDAVRGSTAPELVLTIRPSVSYRSALTNFFVSWPGFLVFAPAWRGFSYRADIVTTIDFEDSRGKFDEALIPISYRLRYADVDLANFATLGLYHALRFDRGTIGPLHLQVKDNYAEFVLKQLDPDIAAAARALDRSGSRTPDPETPARR